MRSLLIMDEWLLRCLIQQGMIRMIQAGMANHQQGCYDKKGSTVPIVPRERGRALHCSVVWFMFSVLCFVQCSVCSSCLERRKKNTVTTHDCESRKKPKTE